VSRPQPVVRNSGVTIVTQTRVRPDATDAFARFQAAISAAVAEEPGFIEQSVLPPNPPIQTDWVILQRFATAEHAIAWLRSECRLALLAEAQPLLVGVDDVHLVRDDAAGALPAPVSAVITTRIKPGREAEFRRWEHRIAAAQARFPGFQGYRFEPPIPGVQEDWLAILRFATDEALQGWMNSPERQSLLREAADFTERVQARIVRAGFAQWFAPEAGQRMPPAWKQNMVVLLLLYPVVFLFGLWVQTPLLMRAGGLPFWLALFVGNVVSVLLLNWLVPRTNHLFCWWLSPAVPRRHVDAIGAASMLALYGACLLAFSLV
jgi:antibiotic biosynthesis monooxygenase (ABM) superfamily enzyme